MPYAQDQKMPRMPAPRPAFRINSPQRADLNRLDLIPVPVADHVPAIARLEALQLLEIDRMAGQGMNLAQIGMRLGFEPEFWSKVIEVNPDVGRAFEAGIVRGIDEQSAAVYKEGKAGNMAAARWYLERFGGEQFQAKEKPAVIVQTASAILTIDQEAIEADFNKQRALLDSSD